MSGADSAAGWKALAELQYQNRCPTVILDTLLVVIPHFSSPRNICSGAQCAT